jgi:hypothetical protein
LKTILSKKFVKMTELNSKISSALKVIEKFGAKLPDDTYLDKTLSGITEEIQHENQTEFDFFWKSSDLSGFCDKHFTDKDEELQSFVFKLSAISCQKSPKCLKNTLASLESCQNLTSNVATFDLLAVCFSQNSVKFTEEFFEKVWNYVLAGVLLSRKNLEKSHFWKSSARKFIVSFVLKLSKITINNSRFLQEHFESRICQVFKDTQASELTSQVLKDVLKTSFQDTDYICNNFVEKIILNYENWPLHVGIYFKLSTLSDWNQLAIELYPENVEEFLMSKWKPNGTNMDLKEWILAAKILIENNQKHIYDFLTENLFSKFEQLAETNPKLIPTMAGIQCNQLKLKVWQVIFDKHLSSYLEQDSNGLPLRDLNVCEDSKILRISLSYLNLLMSSIGTIQEQHWQLLIKLTTIAELDPVSRSMIIDVLRRLIESDLISSLSIESLASQLWHLMRFTDWETKDAILYCLASDKLISDSNLAPKALLGLVKSCLYCDCSFVRTAAILLLGKLLTIQKDCWPNLHEIVQEIFKNETEAIVRRQAAKLVATNFNRSSGIDEVMMIAIKDLDWEVKQWAFKYWSQAFEEVLEESGESPDDFISNIKTNARIIKGLHCASIDYERKLQNEAFEFFKVIRGKVLKKYPVLKLSDMVSQKEPEDSFSPPKKPKLEENDELKFLIEIIFEINVEAKIKEYEDYCNHHYGLNSVLEDIIQLEANQSKIDVIDCF